MGNRPKPTILKLISGSRVVRKDLENEPQPEGELYAPPEELSERECVIWRRTIARAPAGLLRDLDSDGLQLYCETWVEREEARADLKRYGAVVKSPVQGIPVQSPFKAIENRCTTILRGMIGDLGFNPASRTKISISGPTSKQNAFAKHAKRRA